MKLFLAGVLLIGGLNAPVFAAQSPETKAAHELLLTMDAKGNYEATLKSMVAMQARQNPSIAPFTDVMLDFFNKYAGWNDIKDEMAGIYARHYSVSELKELQKFYATPIGKKSLKIMPQITAEGAEIGQKRVKAHMSELQKMIKEAALKKQ